MVQSTKATVDGTTNTASLEIYVDSILVTTYSYDGTNFTLSERPSETTLSRADLSGNVADIGLWMESVRRRCTVLYPYTPHSFDADDHANRTVYRMRPNGVLAIHAIYHKDPDTFTFKERPALLLNPEEFRQFDWVLRLMLATGTSPMRANGWMT